MQNSIKILCTRPVDDVLIEAAKAKGIEIEVIPFIETAPIQSSTLQNEINNAATKNITIVFTSMNAVDVVVSHMDMVPNWRIFCMGNTTRQLVEKHFGKTYIAGIAATAADLAKLIVDENISKEIIFFCGDQRRDDLPDILNAAGIQVSEIAVYKTILQNHLIQKKYDGILFFSPSAVESFFTVNAITAQTVLFAIGQTSASAIRQYCSNKIITAATATKDDLVLQMIDFYSTPKDI